MKKYVCSVAIALALVAALGLSAQQQASHDHSANTTSNSDWSDLTSSMEKMHAAMGSIEPSGNGDADFVRLMLPHHQAAIDMAKAQLMYGTDPQIRRLAQEIITDQESEIEVMQLWLKQHGPQK